MCGPRAALLMFACMLAAIACGGADSTEVEPIVEYSCDNPDAPSDRLFARGEDPEPEIRWDGGEWQTVTPEQYDAAVVERCYR